jgi:RNA polymerase sigma factor (sigma-70 family)
LSGFQLAAASILVRDMMPDESQLLAEFTQSRSEAAFEGIIQLHSKLVFATALRQVGDRRLAEEVTQSVFVAFSERAASLKGDRTLAGWLYRTTLNQARQCVRAELRRKRREEIAGAVAELEREGDSIWTMLIPLLDEALFSLHERDRLAVMLHFMEERPFREVGAVLRLGEDAARKRVQRAVTSLTSWFRNRGVAAPTTAIIAALSLEGISAPAVTAASILALGGAVTGSSLSLVALFMTSTQIKIGVAIAVLAVAVTTPLLLRKKAVEQATGAARAGTEPGDAAQRKQSPAASAVQAAIPAPQRVEEKSFLQRLNDGEMSLSMLSRDEAEAFLALNKTNASSLLAAYRVTHDLEYLRLAATRYPNDPAVLLRAVTHDAFPEARREWIDKFKSADPNNALPYYLSASRSWKDNDQQAALQELATAAQKSAFNDYVTDHMQSLEEIYLNAGHSAAEAKALATHAVELPHISQVVELSRGMVEIVKQAQATGDAASVETTARIGLAMADHLNSVQDGGNLLGQMVGVAVQQRLLSQLDRNQNYPFLSGTVDESLSALSQREKSIRQDSQFIGDWIAHAPEQEAVSYFDRLKLYGEAAAIQWLKNRSHQ